MSGVKFAGVRAISIDTTQSVHAVVAVELFMILVKRKKQTNL